MHSLLQSYFQQTSLHLVLKLWTLSYFASLLMAKFSWCLRSKEIDLVGKVAKIILPPNQKRKDKYIKQKSWFRMGGPSIPFATNRVKIFKSACIFLTALLCHYFLLKWSWFLFHLPTICYLLKILEQLTSIMSSPNVNTNGWFLAI